MGKKSYLKNDKSYSKKTSSDSIQTNLGKIKKKNYIKKLVKNYAFKLKLFAVHHKRDKGDLKEEKESIKRTLYKCPYCSKSYSNVTRYEVHLRTHVNKNLKKNKK